ncbi:MAG: hypothetical protein VYA34_04880 [Myxococcota bacterium]|nr:hypothetical protein [Myxococcota bacterium]
MLNIKVKVQCCWQGAVEREVRGFFAGLVENTESSVMGLRMVSAIEGREIQGYLDLVLGTSGVGCLRYFVGEFVCIEAAKGRI